MIGADGQVRAAIAGEAGRGRVGRGRCRADRQRIAAAAARTGKEVRAGLAGIMDIQILVITPVPVTGGAGPPTGCCCGSRSLRGRIWPVAGPMERMYRYPARPAAPLSRNLLGDNTRR